MSQLCSHMQHIHINILSTTTYTKTQTTNLHSKLTTLEGLSEFPTSRYHIRTDHRSTIAGCDYKGEALANEICLALPILPPVSGHWLPPS